MIGVTRRILDSILSDLVPIHLTHEVLATLMAEVTAIVNARPLVPVPSDPEMPEILTPATRNLEEGDLVLFHCNESPRNYWPLARITKPYVSTDGKVRKVDLVTAKEGSTRRYTRPLTEVILLKSEKDFEKIKTPLGLTKVSDRLVKCHSFVL